MPTQAQLYVEEHGTPDDDAIYVDAHLEAVLQGPPVSLLTKWDGRGALAPYAVLEPNLTQVFRLLGEECTVVGCSNVINAPTYMMELVGAPTCMACAQKICLQQFKGAGPAVYDPELEEAGEEDLAKLRTAGVKFPGDAPASLKA